MGAGGCRRVPGDPPLTPDAPDISLVKMGILEGIIGPLLQKYLGAYFEGTSA